MLALVGGDESMLPYLMGWMADVVQRPHKPSGIALAFRGGQGTGKSTFAKWFGTLFGSHFMHLDSEHSLLGHFNAHLHNAILILADEAVWAGGKAGLGALKRMITEQTLSIERKGMDVINVKNMLHMIVASNEDWFVPVGFDDRRFATFEVATTHQNNWAFFKAVYDELHTGGGFEALLYDLLEFDLNSVEIRDIPRTHEHDRQKQQSMNPKQAWWFEVLESGVLWRDAKVHPEHLEIPGRGWHDAYEVNTDEVFNHYCETLRKSDHRANTGFKSGLSRFLGTVLPHPFPGTIQHGDGKRAWLLPDLATSRAQFEKVFRMRWKWSDPEPSGSTDIPF
jgi:hypothetical protein